MNQLLEKAMEAVRRLPEDEQDGIARIMLHFMDGDRASEEIEAAHMADVVEALSQARRGEFATDAEVEATFRRFGR